MKSKNNQKQNGFAILLLDILFIVFGIAILIISILRNQEIIRAIFRR